MTALCKNDLSSDLNSTFGFRFFANKPPRLALRVFSHAHKLLNFDGTRGSRCQAPMGDPREKKPSIPIHRKRGGRVYRFRTIWNLMELESVPKKMELCLPTSLQALLRSGTTGTSDGSGIRNPGYVLEVP